jgi:hypothetical protein
MGRRLRNENAHTRHRSELCHRLLRRRHAGRGEHRSEASEKGAAVHWYRDASARWPGGQGRQVGTVTDRRCYGSDCPDVRGLDVRGLPLHRRRYMLEQEILLRGEVCKAVPVPARILR